MLYNYFVVVFATFNYTFFKIEMSKNTNDDNMIVFVVEDGENKLEDEENDEEYLYSSGDESIDMVSSKKKKNKTPKKTKMREKPEVKWSLNRKRKRPCKIIVSVVEELCKEKPELVNDEDMLIESIADMMRKEKPPKPPENYYKIFNFEDKDKYACTYCDAVNNSEGMAAHHYQFKHGDFYLTCYACGIPYKNTTNLYKHEKHYCTAPHIETVLRARGRHLGRKGRGRPYTSDNKFITAKQWTKKQKSKLQCSQCPSTFIRREALEEHENGHAGIRPFQCHLCPIAYASTRLLNRHLKQHSEQPFICDHCGKVFTLRPELVAHLGSHLPIRKHACPHCERRFVVKASLQHHINVVHLNAPAAHGCPACPKGYPTRAAVKEHMKKVHGLLLIPLKCHPVKKGKKSKKEKVDPVIVLESLNEEDTNGDDGIQVPLPIPFKIDPGVQDDEENDSQEEIIPDETGDNKCDTVYQSLNFKEENPVCEEITNEEEYEIVYEETVNEEIVYDTVHEEKVNATEEIYEETVNEEEYETVYEEEVNATEELDTIIDGADATEDMETKIEKVNSTEELETKIEKVDATEELETKIEKVDATEEYETSEKNRIANEECETIYNDVGTDEDYDIVYEEEVLISDEEVHEETLESEEELEVEYLEDLAENEIIEEDLNSDETREVSVHKKVICGKEDIHRLQSRRLNKLRPKRSRQTKSKHVNTSYVKELREKYPKMAKDEELLIETLVAVMKSTIPPELPDGCYNVVTLEGDVRESYECAKCEASSYGEPEARRHYQQYHGEPYLICLACGRHYITTRSLYEHEKRRCTAPDIGAVLEARARLCRRTKTDKKTDEDVLFPDVKEEMEMEEVEYLEALESDDDFSTSYPQKTEPPSLEIEIEVERKQSKQKPKRKLPQCKNNVVEKVAIDEVIDGELCNIEYKRRKKGPNVTKETKRPDDEMQKIVRNIKSTITSQKSAAKTKAAKKPLQKFYDIKREFIDQLKNEIEIPKPNEPPPNETDLDLVPGTEIPESLVTWKRQTHNQEIRTQKKDKTKEEKWKDYKNASEKNKAIADYLEFVEVEVVPKNVTILRRGRQIKKKT